MSDLPERIFILVIDVGAAASLGIDVADIFRDLLKPSVGPGNVRLDPVECELRINDRAVHFSFLTWPGLLLPSETVLPRLADLIRRLQYAFDGFVMLRAADSVPSERGFSSFAEGLEGSIAFTSVQLNKEGVNLSRELWAAISEEVAEVSRRREA